MMKRCWGKQSRDVQPIHMSPNLTPISDAMRMTMAFFDDLLFRDRAGTAYLINQKKRALSRQSRACSLLASLGRNNPLRL